MAAAAPPASSRVGKPARIRGVEVSKGPNYRLCRQLADFHHHALPECVNTYLHVYACSEPQNDSQVEVRDHILRELRAETTQGQTLAHYVCSRNPKIGGYEILRLLHKLGVNCDKMDDFNQTPLFYACREGNADAVAFLLSVVKTNPSHVDKNKQTPLFYAVKSASDQLMHRDQVQHQIRSGITTIQGADGRVVKVKPDMRKSADPNGKSHKQNRLDCVRLLAEYGCDLFHRDGNNFLAQAWALDRDCIKLLDDLTALHQTSRGKGAPKWAPRYVAWDELDAPSVAEQICSASGSPADLSSATSDTQSAIGSATSSGSRHPGLKRMADVGTPPPSLVGSKTTSSPGSTVTTTASSSSKTKLQRPLHDVTVFPENLLGNLQRLMDPKCQFFLTIPPAPCLYMSKPCSWYEGIYMVTYSQQVDYHDLAELETEFIHDHACLLQERFNPHQPPPATVCKAVGLNADKNVRQTIIKNIAGQRNKLACTLKVVHVNPYAPPAEVAANAPQAGNNQGTKGRQAHLLDLQLKVAGYVYQKGKQARRAVVDFERDKEHCPTVEISHLKIGQAHGRRGVAVMLYCGLVEHLARHGLHALLQDMRLSVFQCNKNAIRLYEKLCFKLDGSPWQSTLAGWPLTDEEVDARKRGETLYQEEEGSDDEEREERERTIGWARYRRLEPGVAPADLLRTFAGHIPTQLKPRLPLPTLKRELDSASSDLPPPKKAREE